MWTSLSFAFSSFYLGRPLPSPPARDFFWALRLPGPQEPPSGHLGNSLTRHFLQLPNLEGDYRHTGEPSFLSLTFLLRIQLTVPCVIFSNTSMYFSFSLPTTFQLPQEIVSPSFPFYSLFIFYL